MAKQEITKVPYIIKEVSVSTKISYACKDNLWNTFEYGLTAQVTEDADMEKINQELWDKALCEVENKIEEATKLYR